ncbi:MAG: adenylate/guanylate cyclase domain-containing protein [Candidatus Eremiobacteraeota bacterium]|nr:adenylate/guanylate cyclase domain-containing protein [Candidatus Eremiobacteraeota bacterium]
METPVVRWGLLAVLSVVWLAFALGWWLSPSIPFAAWENSWLDHLQRARLRLRGPEPTDSRFLLIAIDEETLDSLAKPQIFWLEDFAELSQGLLDGGARAIAFDAIFANPSQGISPALQVELEEDRLKFLQVLASGKVALGYLPDDARLGVHNHPDLEAVCESFHNLCSLGLIADPDGFYRRLYPTLPGKEKPNPSLALWLAEKLGSQVVLNGGRPRIDGHPVPLEGSPPLLSLRSAYRDPDPPFVSASLLLRQLRSGQRLTLARDRVCLIAPTATSLGDFRPSVYDDLASKRDLGGTMGVEHHLAAAQTLARGTYIRVYPAWLGGLLSGVLCLMMLALGYAAVSWWWPAATLLAHLLAGILAFSLANVWLPFWGPLLAGLFGYTAGYQWRYLTVERQRRLTVELFSRMVSPQVVDKVLSDPGLRQLGGTQRRVTVLYTDINDFTPMCERHTPGEVIVLLNQYFEEMVQVIFRREGMLKQFVGDEIMVIYGAPVEQPDHAARAVETALDMLERLQQMERAAGGEDGFFDIKVGINTGDVVVGHVGSDKHMEYAAVGDDVNLGARIMATTKKLGVKILVSEVTKREAEPLLPQVEWISHGVQSFKGKTAQMEVFEVRRRS